jgi:hypothetical protein
MGGECGMQGDMRNAYKILVGKPEGKTPLGRPRLRWAKRIKMDIGKIGFEGADWVYMAQFKDH